MTDNANPNRALANGVKAEQYALVWHDVIIRQQVLQFLESNSGDIYLPNGWEPDEVLVRPILTDSMKKEWNESFTLIPDDYIIPVRFTKQRATLYARQISIEAIIEEPEYESAFIYTIHKAQGLSIPKVIISFLDRPTLPSRKCFFSTYVALSRVERGDDFRVLADLNDLTYLKDLTPPIDLLAFIYGYDENGIWNANRASTELIRLKDMIKSENKNKSSSNKSKKTTSTSITGKSSLHTDGLSYSTQAKITPALDQNSAGKQPDTTGYSTSLNSRAIATNSYQPHYATGQHNSTSINMHVKGLKNLGNTCYINSVVQCLSHIPQFLEILDVHSTKPVLKCLSDLIAQLKLTSEQQFVKPTKFVEMTRGTLQYQNGKYNNPYQQDALEYLNDLIDALHMELNCKSGIITSDQQSLDYYADWKAVNESKIVDAFYG